VEFDYDEDVDNLYKNIQKYADELKVYEKEYNFPHFFARMRKYQGHLLFDNKRYNEAIILYKESLIILSKHGGYSKYSLDSELENLSVRLKRINDKELLLKLVNSLCKSFKQDKANEKLISWSQNKLLQIEYGV
jgi:tetratricopeptide (TPR) repeat protein